MVSLRNPPAKKGGQRLRKDTLSPLASLEKARQARGARATARAKGLASHLTHPKRGDLND